MRCDVARQLGLDVLEVGEILREADQPARAVERRLGEFHQAARAGHDDVVAFRLRHHRAARPSGERPPALADRAGADFAPLGQRLLRRRIDRRGIGAVAVDEPEIDVAAPHRQRQQIEHAAQALVLHARGLAFRRGRGATRRVDEPEQIGHRRAVISREAAPACIQRGTTRNERERHAEAGAVGAKPRHRRLERRRVLGLEPREEIGEAPPVRLGERRDRTDGEALGIVAVVPAVERGRHGAEDSVALGERRGGAVALRAQAQGAALHEDQQHGASEHEDREDCAQRAE